MTISAKPKKQNKSKTPQKQTQQQQQKTNTTTKQTDTKQTSTKQTTPQLPSYEPLFSISEVSGANTLGETLTAQQVLEFALLYSECPLNSSEAATVLKNFESIKKEVTSNEYQKMSQQDRGRAVLKLLYRDYLKKYSKDQTKLNTAFLTGEYNCVSSALMYMAAAKAAGLTVRGQKTPEHAFCTVYIEEIGKSSAKKIDVETTNPYGFSPGSKETIENEDNIKRYYVVPKSNYANRLEVSDKVFTTLIGGNLCADYITRNDYIKAIPLGAARMALVQSEKSSAVDSVRREFEILATNYVSLSTPASINKAAAPGQGVTGTAQKMAVTVDWFAGFIKKWGLTTNLQNSMDIALYNLMVLCYQEINYQIASDNYQKCSGYVSKAQKDKCRELVAEIYILDVTNGLDYQHQIPLLAKILTENDDADSLFSSAQVQQKAATYLERAWAEDLNGYIHRKEYEAGYERAVLAAQQLPKSSMIQNAKTSFYSSAIATVHNNFANAANKGDSKTAIKILEDGLKKYPEDPTLKKDLQSYKKSKGIK